VDRLTQFSPSSSSPLSTARESSADLMQLEIAAAVFAQVSKLKPFLVGYPKFFAHYLRPLIIVFSSTTQNHIFVVALVI
jgi:hypothetical protein